MKSKRIHKSRKPSNQHSNKLSVKSNNFKRKGKHEKLELVPNIKSLTVFKLANDIFYKEAGKLICAVRSKSRSLRSLLFDKSIKSNKRHLLAVASKSLRHMNILARILIHANILVNETVHPKTKKLLPNKTCHGHGCDNCVHIAETCDMLFGNADPISSPMMSKLLKNALAKVLEEEEYSSLQDYLDRFNDLQLPKFCRINKLLVSEATVLSRLEESGFIYRKYSKSDTNYEEFLELVKNLAGNEFTIDYHIDCLLVFSHKVKTPCSDLIKRCRLILQDKASCLPPIILNPPLGSHVIDSCAAPGNKTSLLAALVGKTGKVLAIDRDPSRFRMMMSRLPRMGCSKIVVGKQMDFLSMNPSSPEFSQYTHIMVDPSCSGSGMIRCPDRRFCSSGKDEQRISSLSNFQAMILKHAFKFPNVQRIVYSTCSFNKEENEQVVKEALVENVSEFRLVNIWPHTWPNKGQHDIAYCLRTNPRRDLTQGFFVACFDKIQEGDEKQPDLDLILSQLDRSAAWLESYCVDEEMNSSPSKKAKLANDSDSGDSSDADNDVTDRPSNKPVIIQQSQHRGGKQLKKLGHVSDQLLPLIKKKKDHNTHSKSNKKVRKSLNTSTSDSQMNVDSPKSNKKFKKSLNTSTSDSQMNVDSPKSNKKIKKSLNTSTSDSQMNVDSPKSNKKIKKSLNTSTSDSQMNVDSPKSNKKIKKSLNTSTSDSQMNVDSPKSNKKIKKSLNTSTSMLLAVQNP